MKNYKSISFIFVVIFSFASSELMAQTRKKSFKSKKTRTRTSSSIKKGKVVRKSGQRKTVTKKRGIVRHRKHARRSIAKRHVRRNIRINRHNVKRSYNGRKGYRPYTYHTYKPYRYGARWHPPGFVLATMWTGAVIISHNKRKYYYNDGVYYSAVPNGYRVVDPPATISVAKLPTGTELVILNEREFYYFGGVFYEKALEGSAIGQRKYRVVTAPDGAIIRHLPEGAEEHTIGGQNYLELNNTYYLPITENGNDVYQVVEMEPF